jgi:hypothetical protein
MRRPHPTKFCGILINTDRGRRNSKTAVGVNHVASGRPPPRAFNVRCTLQREKSMRTATPTRRRPVTGGICRPYLSSSCQGRAYTLAPASSGSS